jgi:DmsE family decaheme c-type cytochrome
VTEFAKSVHAKSWSALGKNADCESCHGNADQHVVKNTKESIIVFGKEKEARPAEEQSKQCLACHAKTPALAMWNSGIHKRQDVSCANCHGIHKEKNVRDPETCFACHKDIKAEVNKLYHHPIKEGKVVCADCHNPHGTQSHGQIKADNINQLCYKCHVDKRGPYIWEHPPVEENCLICHNPHGSNNTRMLTEHQPQLCQSCHEGTSHVGQAWDARFGFRDNTNLVGSVPSERLIARSCVNCHGKIHGSNTPGTNGATGQFFRR